MKAVSDIAGKIRIERLKTGDFDVFAAFFEGPAFADNPYWRSCFCTFFHKPEQESAPSRGAVNTPGSAEGAAGPAAGARAKLSTGGPALGPRLTNRELCRRLIEGGMMQGYLARDATGAILGWCNANDRSRYERLGEGETRGRVKAVVCFVIDPRYRRCGIASTLLGRVVADARVEGYEAVEAYPSLRAVKDSGNFRGPRRLYEAHLFVLEKRGRKTVARLEFRDMGITYRELVKAEIELIRGIDRSEVIEEVYHLRGGKLVVEREHYDMKGFPEGELDHIIERQNRLLEDGGRVVGAFQSGKLVGVASVEKKRRGEAGRWIKLDILFTSAGFRDKGIARELMSMASSLARGFGGSLLYISATPARHTVDFYLRRGCRLVEKPDPELFAMEPEDIHLELELG